MTDHQPMPISGYTSQSEKRVSQVNFNKKLEEECLQTLDLLKADADVDPRWLAIGRTQLEQAFMAINRSIFKPTRTQT